MGSVSDPAMNGTTMLWEAARLIGCGWLLLYASLILVEGPTDLQAVLAVLAGFLAIAGLEAQEDGRNLILNPSTIFNPSDRH